MKRTLCVACVAFLFAPAMAPAQASQAPAAVIDYASGDDVTVIRSSKRLVIDDIFGFGLMVGDQVQTGRGVFIEMRMTEGGSVIKLAENTTFVLQKAASGQTSIALVYGRIRAKVEKLTGTDSFSLSSPSAIAGVRGTDFGMDIIAPRGAVMTDPVTRVYCFEGAVDVTALIDTATSKAEDLEPVPRNYRIEAGEMVTVSRVEDKRQAQKTGLEPAIRSFWTTNNFSTEPLGVAPGPTPPQPALSPTPAQATPAQATPSPVAPAAASSAPGAAPGADQLAGAFDDGFSSGYGKGFLEGQAKREAPAGYLSPEEAGRLRKAMANQRGGLITGGLIAMAGAALAGTGLIMQSGGESLAASYLLQTGVILTGLSVPFLLISLSLGN